MIFCTDFHGVQRMNHNFNFNFQLKLYCPCLEICLSARENIAHREQDGWMEGWMDGCKHAHKKLSRHEFFSSSHHQIIKLV